MLEKLKQLFCIHDYHEHNEFTKGSFGVIMVEQTKVCKKCTSIKMRTYFIGR